MHEASHTYLAFNARYVIAPDTAVEDLVTDLLCLFEAGLGIFEARFEELDQTGVGGVFLLRQSLAVLQEINRKIERGGAAS